MDLKHRTVGQSQLSIPPVCFGTSGLGSMPATYGYSVSEQEAVDTLLSIFSSEYPFIDTSRNYGMGESERRIGLALAELGGLPDNAVISTKLDRDMDTGKFDAARARISLEESLNAMGVDRVQLLHLHDPEHALSIEDITAAGGAMDELVKIKEEGLADAIGLAAGNIDVMLPIVKAWDLDAMVTHNRYTLLNRNAQPLLDLAKEKDISVLNAAPYCGGMLARGSQNCSRYVYQEIDNPMLERVRALEKLSEQYSVPLGAAALQFSLRSSFVQSTICGVSKPSRVSQTLSWMSVSIPEEFWQEVADLPYDRSDPEANRQYDPG